MKAAVFREVNQPMDVEEIDIAKPGPREVLVRTVAAGVCHSDMHFFNGTYPGQLPVVLGHESAGIVEQVGDQVSYVKPGDHVITCLSVFCGHCEYCLTGHMSPVPGTGSAAGAGGRAAPVQGGRPPSASSPTSAPSPNRCWCMSTPW